MGKWEFFQLAQPLHVWPPGPLPPSPNPQALVFVSFSSPTKMSHLQNGEILKRLNSGGDGFRDGAGSGAVDGVCRKQRWRRMFLLQELDDGQRLRQGSAPVDQHGDLGHRVFRLELDVVLLATVFD